MKIVADADIPFLEGVFEPYADMMYKKGDQIVRDDLMDADVLIVRTRTQCNADLLEGTPVKMVTTATIGMDHIDLEYCQSRGIKVANAAGCNAGGVMQYVFSAVYGVAARKGIKLDDAKFGIVGVGNVGTKSKSLRDILDLKSSDAILLVLQPRERKASALWNIFLRIPIS